MQAEPRDDVAEPRRWRISWQRWLLLFTLLSIVVPLVTLVYGSLRSAAPGDPAGAFTVKNWLDVFTSPRYTKAFLDLGWLALGASLIAVSIGTILAFLVARTNMPGRSLLEVVILIPMFMSSSATAVAWVILASPRSGFLNVLLRWLDISGLTFNVFTPLGIIWVLGISQVPYAFLLTVSAFRSIDPTIEEAARMLGAQRVYLLRRITFPLVTPAILSAFILVFVLSASEFAVPGLLGRQSAFLPVSVQIYQVFSHFPANYGLGSALSILLVVLSVVLLIPYKRLVDQAHRFVTVTGKGGRVGIIDLGRWKYPVLLFSGAYVLVGIVLPYVALFGASLLRYLTPRLSWQLLTFRNWVRVAEHPSTALAMKNTIIIGLVGSVLVILIGAVASWIALRNKHGVSQMLDYVVMFPIAVPGIVMGAGLLWLFTGIPGSLITIWPLVYGFFIRHIPYAVRSFAAALLQLHQELEESARMLGATDQTVFRRIVLPLVKPAAFAVWIMVFTLMVRELSTVIMLYNPRTIVMSILVWDLMEAGDYTMAASLALLQTLLIIAIIVVAQRVFKVRLSVAQL